MHLNKRVSLTRDIDLLKLNVGSCNDIEYECNMHVALKLIPLGNSDIFVFFLQGGVIFVTPTFHLLTNPLRYTHLRIFIFLSSILILTTPASVSLLLTYPYPSTLRNKSVYLTYDVHFASATKLVLLCVRLD